MKLESLSNAQALPIEISQNALNENVQLGTYFGTPEQLRDVVT